jgi:hypothetical protein
VPGTHWIKSLRNSSPVDRRRNRYASMERHEIMVHPRTLTIGVTVNLDNYENLRVEVTDEAGSPDEARRLIEFLDGVLASMGRGDGATAERIDHYRNRLFRTQSPGPTIAGPSTTVTADGTDGPGLSIPAVSTRITNLTAPESDGSRRQLPDRPASAGPGFSGTAVKGSAGKHGGRMPKETGDRSPDGTAASGVRTSSGSPGPISPGAPAVPGHMHDEKVGGELPAGPPSRVRDVVSLPEQKSGVPVPGDEGGSGADHAKNRVEMIPGAILQKPATSMEKETTSGPEGASVPGTVCESCGAQVTATEKKMSQLFASKTLCRRCMPRA